MTFVTRAALAAALWAGLALGASAQRPSYPPALQTALNEARQMCADAGGLPFNATNAIESRDLNGDNVADFVVRDGLYHCQGAASLYAGNSEGQIMVFDGANRAANAAPFVSPVIMHVIDTAGPRPMLVLVLGGQFCGAPPARSRAEAASVLCERPVAWNATARRFDLTPMTQRRPYRETFDGYR